MIGQIDDNYPLFIREGKKLVLNRELLTEFQSKLNYRDQLILDCLISTGLDDGDLLKLNVDFVLSQNQPRLYLNNNRQKTLEDIHVFFSKIASKKIREYVRKERREAEPNDPLFITTLAERKRVFLKIHGRKYTNLDELPEGNRLSNVTLAINFRKASRHTGISLVKQQQSPLRPKRLRKVFESACTHAGIDPDIKDIFMGHKGSQSKTYQGKSREELEFYYDMVEPKITIQIHETDESTELREKLKEFQNTKSNEIQELTKKVQELEETKENETRWLELSMAKQKDTDEFIQEIMQSLYDGTGVMVSENRMEQVTPDGEKRKKEWIKKLEKAIGKKYKIAQKPIAITKEMMDDAEKLHKEKKKW